MLLATYWESRDDDVVASSEDANEDAETGIVFVVVDSPMVVLWPNMGGSSVYLSTRKWYAQEGQENHYTLKEGSFFPHWIHCKI